jgi:hypothetical protein
MVKIFVSHSTTYKDIAKSLKLSLQALESETLLDIKISEEMAGATDWRRWIDDNVRSSDIFLLLFPHANMDMGWCNYELGRFYDEKRHVVCIKNTDITEPPPAFQPYQAYDGGTSAALLNSSRNYSCPGRLPAALHSIPISARSRLTTTRARRKSLQNSLSSLQRPGFESTSMNGDS